MKKILLLALLLVAVNGFAQKTTISPTPSTATQKVESEKPDFTFTVQRGIDMIGESFVLLPIFDYEPVRKLGYSLEKEASGERLSYDQAGKIIKLVSYSNDYGHFIDEQGNKFRQYSKDNFNQMAPLKVFEFANKWLLNKTFWLKGDKILTYNKETKEYDKIENLKLEPLKVINITASDNWDLPLMLSLQTSKGEIGFLDVAIQAHNAAPNPNDTFTLLFYTEDPTEGKKYPAGNWDLIKRGMVKLGMSKDEVALALGPPKSINNSGTKNRSFDQWVYERANYYFTNGKLTNIQK